ncbi:MAG: hypothetical protein A2046_13625 [Bacteroidetes bacterium GWA2_30_7]|nr:MAG: hypothetical protein A2046_13625 [Bacteroidetes bacterium GWA2_30_7]
MRITVLTLVLSVLVYGFSYAQQKTAIIEWQKCLGGSSTENYKSFQLSPDGGFTFAGYTASNNGDVSGNHSNDGHWDCWVVKTDSIANIVWQKCLGSTLGDAAYSIQTTVDSGYIMAGEVYGNDGDVSGNNYPPDIWIVKLNSTGDIEWQKCLGGSSSDQEPKVLKQTNDGGYILGAITYSNDFDVSGNHGNYDCWIVKLDSIGNIEWQKCLGGTAADYVSSILLVDNGFIVAGSSQSINGDVSGNHGGNDAWIVKIDSIGNIEWQKCYGGTGNENVNSILLVDDGFIFACGSYSIDGDVYGNHGSNDAWLVKIDFIGNIEWQKCYGGSLSESAVNIQLYDNGFIFSGYSTSTDGDISGNHGGSDAWIVKIDSVGNIDWQKCFGGTANEIAANFMIFNGGLTFFGNVGSNNNGDVSGYHGGTDFWIVKLREIIPNEINGIVYNDLNNNCNKESNDIPLKNIIIQTNPGNFFANTNDTGYYSLLTDTGIYQVNQIIPQNIAPLFNNLNCPNNPDYYTLSFDTSGIDICCFDFANDVNECYVLSVDITSNRRRRCFNNNTILNYCNNGLIEANSVEVYVQFPEYLHFVSSNYSYTLLGNNTYRFDIGTLQAGECGAIKIVDSVSCENGIMGLTQCTKTWILPENDCLHQLQDTSTVWDKSSVKVIGSCIQDSIAYFIIVNTGGPGNGDMDAPSEYRIFADGILSYTGTFQLVGGDTLELFIVANGATIRVEADQRPGHPGNSNPNDVVEACGFNEGGVFSLGFLNQQSVDDGNDVATSESCLEIRDSYDPNDKQVIPSGVTLQHFVQSGTMLDFTIRFQNTGNDTAYKVVIIDTLSTMFDVSTLQFGARSHDYTLNVSGQNNPILKFTFNNINLTDSVTNEPNSHGFVNFKIAPLQSTLMGTVISNFADIYFDYNLPIKTNISWVTISDTVLTGSNIIILNNPITNTNFSVNIYPNPAFDEFYIEYEETGKSKKVKEYKLYGIEGKKVLEGKLESPKTRISTKDLESGVYFIEVSIEGEKINSKLVITK